LRIKEQETRLTLQEHDDDDDDDGKVPLEQTTKAQRGSRCIALLFL
jgi:hypothetical protein